MTPLAIEDVYPLSPSQQGLLFHSLYAPGSDFYLDQLVSDVLPEETLDESRFADACRWLVARHASLRSAFAWEGDKPLQVIMREIDLELSRHDWRDLPDGEQERRLDELLAAGRRRSFDLARPGLLRLALVRRAAQRYWLLFTYHHLLLDAWSVGVLLRELDEAYAALAAGREPNLPPARPYRDYVAWLKRRPPDDAERYWRESLAGRSAPPRLSIVRAGTARESPCIERKAWLSAEVSEALRETAARQRTTVFTLVQAAWAWLVARYCGENEVVLGIAFSGRPAELRGSRSMVGLFINTLPVRARVPSTDPWSRWVEALHRETNVLRRYEYSALSDVQRWSGAGRGVPLFESVFAFENVPSSDVARGPLGLREGRYLFRTNYPLNLMVEPGPRFRLRLNCDGSRFDPPAVERLLAQLAQTMQSLPAEMERPVRRLPWLTPEERRQLRAWNDTAAPRPTTPWLRLFEEHAARRRDSVAVETGEDSISYGLLATRAAALAATLRAMGAGPEVPVGVCATRSVDLVVCILAILEAGAAYLPLDPAYPSERLAWMVHDSKVDLILAEAATAARVPPGPRVVRIDAASGEPATASVSAAIDRDHPAYVIYTSGSTGRPKGVALTHRGLDNLIPAWNRLFGADHTSRVLQFASISFDASVWEILSALCAGATLCFGSRETLYGAQELVGMLRSLRITHALLPPSLLGALDARGLEGLRSVAAIGEKCTAAIARRWSRGRRLVNAYGPAETTITVCTHLIDPARADESDPPIGRPMDNVRLYVVDADLELVPVGVPGELCIAGENVGRGYLGRPAASAERFVPDPFSGARGARLYRSGDMARWREDGELEFLGRVDQQVKIRGVRVEPGEIERTLARHASVLDVRVVARVHQPSGERRLVAYVVRRDRETGWAEIKAFAARHLPVELLPSAVMFLDALPLSPNGKVDTQALPPPDWSGGAQRTGVAPRNDIERTLARVWEEVLGVPRVSVHDNYFDLGGDSLTSIRLIARAARAGVRITARQVFERQTIAGLAEVATLATRAVVAEHADEGEVPLTPPQQRFLAEGRRDPNHFNQAVLLEAPGPLDAGKLRSALAALERTHDALRLRLDGDGRSARIAAASEGGIPLDTVEVAALDGAGRDAAVAGAAAEAHRALDLERGPLARAVLFDGGPTRRTRLLLVVHHFAVDALSWPVLVEDLSSEYRGEGGRARPTPWAAWARQVAQSAWPPGIAATAERLAAESRCAMPLSVRHATAPHQGAEVFDALAPPEAARKLARLPHVEIEAAALAALAAACRPFAAGPAALIEVERHGRSSGPLDVSRTVGWFTCWAPIALPLEADAHRALDGARRRLASIAADAEAYALARWSRMRPELFAMLEGAPQASVAFTYLGTVDQIACPPFIVAPGDVGPLRSPRDAPSHALEVTVWWFAGTLHARFEAAADAADAARQIARWWSAALLELAAAACAGPAAAALSEIDLGADA